MRILGIDYGDARVGLALGDTESRIASPWGTITESDQLTLLAKIHDIVQRDLVDEIVIGVPHPLQDSGHVNAQVKHTRQFIEALEKLGKKVHEESEALSSKLAARQMEASKPIERGRKRGAGALEKRDDLAAAAILQSWLDRKR